MGKTERTPVLGVDIGGTGIKAALVDLHTGKMVSERIKFGTPQPSTPSAIAKSIREIGGILKVPRNTKVGCGFPGVVIRGMTCTAANVDKRWMNLKAETFLSRHTGYKITMINDADAAGLAECAFGRIKDRAGTVILLTIGTGIGSAIFVDGKLVPNTELGHLRYHDGIAEDYASNRARKEKQLTYRTWGSELNALLKHICVILNPDLIVLGGGVSKRFSYYKPYVDPGVEVLPARLRNDAGIIGAAMCVTL